MHQCHGDVASYSVKHEKYPSSSYRLTSQQCPRQMRTLHFDFSINDNHFITDMGRREWKDLDHVCLFVCFFLLLHYPFPAENSRENTQCSKWPEAGREGGGENPLWFFLLWAVRSISILAARKEEEIVIFGNKIKEKHFLMQWVMN